MAIVVSHVESSFDALVAQALRQAALADVIELCLDRCGHPGKPALERAVAESSKPLIASCPRVDVGGEFTGSVDEQLQLLVDAAEAGFHFVDVDWTLSLELCEVPGKCHRIVSRHDHEGTPDDLESPLEEVRAVLYEGDLIKFVTRANTTADGMRVLRFLRAVGGGLIAFAMGERGSFTRVLAPIMGSPFTYCSAARLPGQEDPEATAPGQWRVNDLRGLYPPGGVNPETAILGVLGRPVTNSWSPLLHGMALKAAKLDAVYLPFEPEELEEFLALCDDENFRGFSVTAPYKQEALRLARESDALSQACGATNTLLRLGDHWRAANTDVPSVAETMEAAFRVHGKSPDRPEALGAARVVVLGAGGAARAVLQAVREAGGQAFVVARRAEAAEALCREMIGTPLALDALEGLEYDVLVNTTPAGSLAQPGELPLPEEWIRPETLVLDAVYRPISTPLLMAAKSRGCTAVPGGEWFVRQAAAQFQLFTGQEPNDALLRATFEHALGGER